PRLVAAPAPSLAIRAAQRSLREPLFRPCKLGDAVSEAVNQLLERQCRFWHFDCGITAALGSITQDRMDRRLPVTTSLSPSQPSGSSGTRWESALGASLKAAPHIAAPFLPRALAPRLRPT